MNNVDSFFFQNILFHMKNIIQLDDNINLYYQYTVQCDNLRRNIRLKFLALALAKIA